MHEAGIKAKGYSKCTNEIPFTRNIFNSQDSWPFQFIVCKGVGLDSQNNQPQEKKKKRASEATKYFKINKGVFSYSETADQSCFRTASQY